MLNNYSIWPFLKLIKETVPGQSNLSRGLNESAKSACSRRDVLSPGAVCFHKWGNPRKIAGWLKKGKLGYPHDLGNLLLLLISAFRKLKPQVHLAAWDGATLGQ